MRVYCVHNGQVCSPTACVHHSQNLPYLQALNRPGGPIQSLSCSLGSPGPGSGPNHSWMRFSYIYHVQIHNPTASTALAGGPMQCLSDLLAFTRARFITELQALTGPEGSSQCLSGLLAFTMAGSVTLQNHLTILRASS